MRTIQATYRDGAFYPTETLSLPPGTSVSISIPSAGTVASVRERYRDVIGAFSADVLDQMEADIEEAFGKPNRTTTTSSQRP